jgi:PHP domain
MKVMIHAHTNFSGDGELSPQALADVARSKGFDAVLVSDHFESLKPAKFAALVDECRRVTNCLMVPGYERSFRGFHILALGVDQWFDDRPFPAWAGRIRSAGGLVAVAHPSRYNHDIPSDILNCCDAVEVWNSKFAYDGELGPNPRAYLLLGESRHPLCSQDLHGVRHASGVGIEVSANCRTADDILACIRRSEYRMTNGLFSFSTSLPGLAVPLLAVFHQARTKTVRAAIGVRRHLGRATKKRDKENE